MSSASRILVCVAMVGISVGAAACGERPLGRPALPAPDLGAGGDGSNDPDGSSPLPAPDATDTGPIGPAPDAPFDAIVPVDGTIGPEPSAVPDGICDPGSPSSGVFDPDCVYLVGTLVEGLSGNDVLIHPSLPEQLVFGFGSYDQHHQVRPLDGRLLFSDIPINTGTYRFYAFTPDPSAMGQPKPGDPLANDQLLLTPACDMPYSLHVFPDDAATVYRCPFGERDALYLVDTTDAVLALPPGSTDVVALGTGRTALVTSSFPPLTLVSAVDGPTPVTGIDDLGIALAARSDGDGFVAAVADTQLATFYRVAVSPAAEGTVVGAYQTSDPSVWRLSVDRCRLEPGGALQCFVHDPGGSDALQRLTIDAPPEIIYDERDHPVKIHIPNLATGP